MNSKTFGEYLCDERTRAGKSLREVADYLGCSHVHLGEVERGKKRFLAERYWDRLKEILPSVNLEILRSLKDLRAPIRPQALSSQDQEILFAMARKLEQQGSPSPEGEEIRKQIRRILGIEESEDE